MCTFWLLLVSNLEKINLLLNSFIFIDMYYTLRNPFELQRNRNKIFTFFSMIAIVFIDSYYITNFSIYDFD